jgi:hypothetical protein
MAKQDFLDNVRIARNLFVHPRVATDSTQNDANAISQMIARAAIWLTPKSVKGFNADDFRELGPERQSELGVAVREFLDVAQEVPPNAPAMPEQLSKAKVAFEKIRQILTPYLPTPQEGDKVEEALKRVDFPSWVVNWDYELGSDEDEMPSVWVNLYADESIAPRKEFGRLAARINRQIHEALSAVGSARWPYVRMRTAVEHKTI